jgi:hypothetical protein
LIRFKDGQYYGYTQAEILQMAIDEWNSPGYQKAKYKRIVVSTRMRDEALYKWIPRFVKATLRSLVRTDLIGRIAERKYKKKYMKPIL